MAGNDLTDSLCEYLGRLRCEVVAADRVLSLRSIERAALASWLRKAGVLFKVSVLASGAPFRVSDLLSTSSVPTTFEIAPAAAERPTSAPNGPGVQVGVDIEDLAALPQADDYREHPFYQDNFTSAEIAYCIRQLDARASFCGMWAAKEAILKTRSAPIKVLSLRDIEIAHDVSGRPVHPDCLVSISHTATSAVAVCLRT